MLKSGESSEGLIVGAISLMVYRHINGAAKALVIRGCLLGARGLLFGEGLGILEVKYASQASLLGQTRKNSEERAMIMLTAERKRELDILLEWASCADDEYYFDMEQEEFEEEMEGSEEEAFYKGYCHQREIGFEAYRTEMVEQFALITDAEELHYMITDFNYDGGAFVVEQIVMNQACNILTAKMVYWLCQPDHLDFTKEPYCQVPEVFR